MYKYFQSHFKTKFDTVDKTIVFTTNKTLNERFTPSPTSRSFTVSNGYTTPYENNYIAERVAFKNLRSMDIHKRISFYERGNLEEVERKVFECVDKNNLNVRVADFSKSRRTVVKPKKWSDEESTKNYEEFEKQRALSPGDFNMSSVKPIEVHPFKGLKVYELISIGQSGEKDYKVRNNSFIFENGSVKHTWDGRFKGKNATHDYRLKGYQGSEPIIYEPYKTNRYSQKSLYRWKRAPPTKKELDDELDSYMSETKFKEASEIPVKDDVDAFVREYMVEAEKSLNKHDFDNLQ